MMTTRSIIESRSVPPLVSFCIDTNVLIDYIDGRTPVVRGYIYGMLDGKITGIISPVVEAEIFTYLHSHRKLLMYRNLLAELQTVPVTSEIARLGGDLARELRAKAYRTNRKIRTSQGTIDWKLGDGIIAATARIAGVPVLTRDSDFVGLSGVKVETYDL